MYDKAKAGRGISWAELSGHDSPGDLWVSIDGFAYNITDWLSQHPGGALVLKHAAGKDASRAFTAYHPAWVRRKLPAFCLGPMAHRSAERDQAAADFDALTQQVEDLGLLRVRFAPYISLAAFLAALLAAAVWCAAHARAVSAALLIALFWQQAAFIGHDVGHSAVTHVRAVDSVIGLIIQACVGIGLSWWKSTHNVHHTVVNAADSDPDIQFMPLVANSEQFFEPLWSTYHQAWLVFDPAAQWLISWQHLSFIPLLMVAKFGLYLQTLKQLLRGKSYISRVWETLAQAAFFSWYIALTLQFQTAGQRLGFVFLSHAAFFVLHLQICLSHFACPTSQHLQPGAENWMTHQVTSTMNWQCPAWLDWFHGGLQFQIEHHLFPRMPRHNLRAAAAVVQPACQKLGLRYHAPTFWQVNNDVYDSLAVKFCRALPNPSVDKAVAETLYTLRQAALLARRQSLSQHPQAAVQRPPPTEVLPRAWI